MNWKIAILLLSLSLVFSIKTSATKPKFAGTYTTETIRQLWEMCSLAHMQARVSANVYRPSCDCAVDTMRQNYDNSSIFLTMEKPESDRLSTLIRLNCNEYRLSGRGTE